MSQVISFNQSADGTVGSVNMGFKAYVGTQIDNFLGSTVGSRTIPYDEIAFDTAGGFNSTTGEFTVPVAGIWFFCSYVRMFNLQATAHDSLVIRVLQNGINAIEKTDIDPTASSSAVQQGYYTSTIQSVINAGVNDVFKTQVNVTGGSQDVDIDDGQFRTFFSGFLVQAL